MAVEAGHPQHAVGPGQGAAPQHSGNGATDANVARLDQIRASLQKPQGPQAGSAS
jgi:hypothetical protein